MIQSFQKRIGFTLMEVIIVMVMLGLIVGFALPSYQKAIVKQDERATAATVVALSAVIRNYQAQVPNVFALIFDETSVTAMNNEFRSNIMLKAGQTLDLRVDNKDDYSISIWNGSVVIEMDESMSEPCCSTGSTCLTISIACP